MKRITWTIGVQKLAGNIIQDAILHYNEPKLMQLDGVNLTKGVHYEFSPDNDGSNYSDVYGYLDFAHMGGLLDTQILLLVW